MGASYKLISSFSLLGEGLFPSCPRCLCRLLVFRVGDSREHIRKVCGDTVFERSAPLWGFDPEGELNGTWRDLGVKGLWSILGSSSVPRFISRPCLNFLQGNFMSCRFHSKHMALRVWSFFPRPLYLVIERSSWICAEIKAMEEGVFQGRYSLVKN